jgi:leucyl/phenylalanyl-tRNA--protein transferase
MTSLIWLDEFTPFPNPSRAFPDGLLAAGGRLSVQRLTEAYRLGIFPWFNPGDPVLWWSPDPRMVLACANLKISKSMGKRLRQAARDEQTSHERWRVTTNMAFAAVIASCAAPRGLGHGTWISPAIASAYLEWHRAGNAHSVETWFDGELVGGLYGVCLGRFFFGESMFSRTSDASKLALAYLVRFLQMRDIHHIDCQQETRHLASLGARPMPRHAFLSLLQRQTAQPQPDWGSGRILQSGRLASATNDAACVAGMNNAIMKT